MKSLLFLILCFFCAFTATAQKEQLQDTSYAEAFQGKLYLVKLVTYTDGSYQKSATPQTDTATILNDYVAKIEARANQIAEAAVIAMQARQASIDFARADTLCIANTNRSPITLLMDTYTKEFEQGIWTITFGGSSKNVSFPVLSTNKRKRLLPQSETAKTMLVTGYIMRITNYPSTGINLLFRVKEGLWSSIDRTVVLKRN